jgi:hypothetical protein
MYIEYKLMYSIFTLVNINKLILKFMEKSNCFYIIDTPNNIVMCKYEYICFNHIITHYTIFYNHIIDSWKFTKPFENSISIDVSEKFGTDQSRDKSFTKFNYDNDAGRLHIHFHYHSKSYCIYRFDKNMNRLPFKPAEFNMSYKHYRSNSNSYSFINFLQL